jgi:hypothetical protein
MRAFANTTINSTRSTNRCTPGGTPWGRGLILLGIALALGGVAWYTAALAAANDIAPPPRVSEDSRLTAIAQHQVEAMTRQGRLAGVIGLSMGAVIAGIGIRMHRRRQVAVRAAPTAHASLEMAYGDGPKWRL